MSLPVEQNRYNYAEGNRLLLCRGKRAADRLLAVSILVMHRCMYGMKLMQQIKRFLS